MNISQILKSTTSFQDFITHPNLEKAYNKEKNKTPKAKTLTLYEVLKHNPILGVHVKDGLAFAQTKNRNWLSFPTQAEDGTYNIDTELKAQNITLSTKKGNNPASFDYPQATQLATIPINLEDIAFLAKAMSTEDTRYYLNGIYFDSQANKMVATDGHRLHAKPAPVTPESFIMSRFFVDLILKYKPESFNLQRLGDKLVTSFTKDDITFYADAVDGTYPDYKQVIPQDNNITIKVKTNHPKLTKCYIAIAEDGESGLYIYDGKDSDGKPTQKWLSGNPISDPVIAFNWDCFKIYGDEPTITIANAKTPAIIGDAILMPIRL